jgi:GNAT superfamily N-acetyltransferase
MTWTIRRADIADTPVLSRLIQELNAYFGMDVPSFSQDLLAETMAGDDPLVFAYLAEAPDGRAAGYALCQKFLDSDTGTLGTWLHDLYVEEAIRGAGLGRRLLAVVARDAKAKGQRMVGWAVYADNPARRLYDRVGAALEDEALVYELRDARLDLLASEAQI